MNKSSAVSFVLVAALTFAGACDDNPPPAPPVQFVVQPIALDQQLVFIDSTNEFAYLLDVGDAKPSAKTTRIPLAPQAALWERRNEHDEALVLCSGQRADVNEEAVPATLVTVGSDGRSLRYELGTTPFNAFKQSDDGRYAIVHRGPMSDTRILDNPNELVVVDLDKEPDEEGAVTRKTPDGLGNTLTSVVVSPKMRIADEERRLLVVLSAAEITLFDLDHLDRRATIVQLDETRTINPEQVVFSPSNPTLYVRAQSSSSIFMFRLEPHDNDALGNDFRPTVNPLSGGTGPRDIALFGTGSGERLIVVAEQSAQVVVVDPSTSKTTALPLKASANKILLFEGPSPSDPRSQTRALLYSEKSTGVSFVDPVELAVNPEDKLETIITPAVSGVLPLLEEGKVLLLQAQAVSVLNLNDRTLTPIASGAALGLQGALFDAERGRLWVSSPATVYLGTLDLANGRTGELRLDAAVGSLVPMFSRDRLAIVHSDNIGYVTLIDLEQPDRAHAISVRGFFVNGVLDRSGS